MGTVLRGIHLNMCSCGGRPEADYYNSRFAPVIKCSGCDNEILFQRGQEEQGAKQWNEENYPRAL